mmetsp:Transcript_22237/g.33977  ORF Transcript_22237/g.33977 Transcript_22237/m.33977 type:complete len:218 (+) Transcript_22237:1712-2365(+)
MFDFIIFGDFVSLRATMRLFLVIHTHYILVIIFHRCVIVVVVLIAAIFACISALQRVNGSTKITAKLPPDDANDFASRTPRNNHLTPFIVLIVIATNGNGILHIILIAYTRFRSLTYCNPRHIFFFVGLLRFFGITAISSKIIQITGAVQPTIDGVQLNDHNIPIHRPIDILCTDNRHSNTFFSSANVDVTPLMRPAFASQRALIIPTLLDPQSNVG